MQSDVIAGAAGDDVLPPPLPSPQRLQELLFDAARLGRCDVIPALLQAGARTDAFDPAGHTPLILACYHGHEEAALMLLALGADPDQRDQARGNTALMGADRELLDIAGIAPSRSRPSKTT